MSWQRGQGFGTGRGQPLAAMGLAALLAANKPLVEQQLREGLRQLENVPSDIDALAFAAGVARYGAIEGELGPRPLRREYPVLAQVGRVCLRDAGGDGAPIVLVPSMINRGYVLDLLPGHSLVGHLRATGRRVLLVDWGEPVVGAVLGLEEVVIGHLEELLRGAADKLGPLALLGYCMGGLLALAAAVRLGPTVVKRLALVAVPWDFSATANAGQMAQAMPILAPWLQGQAVVPPEVLAHYFWLLDPWSPVRRMMAYGRESLDKHGRGRLVFLTALEDWLADGMALDGPVAQQMMTQWYGENTPMAGRWQVGGVTITPRALQVPLWVAVSQRDVLVPPLSALALLAQANNPASVMVNSGHVGLVCGRRAATDFYAPLVKWLGV